MCLPNILKIKKKKKKETDHLTELLSYFTAQGKLCIFSCRHSKTNDCVTLLETKRGYKIPGFNIDRKLLFKNSRERERARKVFQL